jgi:hypothetical protein
MFYDNVLHFKWKAMKEVIINLKFKTKNEVNVKLSMCLINSIPHHEEAWGMEAELHRP